MTAVTDWLKARAPGFAQLSQEEQDAIADFSFLWGLFESRILNTNANAQAICDAVDSWHAQDMLAPDLLDTELTYFKARYHPQNAFAHHFEGLHLRAPDLGAIVRGVLEGSDHDPRRRLAAALIIIYRYRNNLFHGVKWEYELADQLDNFTHANSALIKVLDRHGRL
jgi:hypothetical protein